MKKMNPLFFCFLSLIFSSCAKLPEYNGVYYSSTSRGYIELEMYEGFPELGEYENLINVDDKPSFLFYEPFIDVEVLGLYNITAGEEVDYSYRVENDTTIFVSIDESLVKGIYCFSQGDFLGIPGFGKSWCFSTGHANQLTLEELTAMTNEIVTASVSSINWQRIIKIEEFLISSGQKWDDEIPSSASIGSCLEKYRYTSDTAQPNSKEVCGEPYDVFMDDGTTEVKQDCIYEVYDQYCEYTISEWAVKDTLTSTGNDLHPYWPDTSISSTERISEQNESYVIGFDVGGMDFTYATNDDNLFQKAEIGSQWQLEISNLGEILSVTPSK